MSVKPIRPDEAIDLKETLLPDAVMEAFNEIIAANLSNGYSRFKRKDVIALIRKKMGVDAEELPNQKIYDNHWLDVEGIFRKVGWSVEHHQPDYTENAYEPYFVFWFRG